MGLGKLIRKGDSKIGGTVRGVANKVVKDAPGILNTASKVLGTVGNIADKVGSVSGKILSNPMVEGFVAANPELAPIYGGALAASKLVGQGGKLADKGSSLASKGSGVASKVGNVLEKAGVVKPQSQAIQFA